MYTFFQIATVLLAISTAFLFFLCKNLYREAGFWRGSFEYIINEASTIIEQMTNDVENMIANETVDPGNVPYGLANERSKSKICPDLENPELPHITLKKRMGFIAQNCKHHKYKWASPEDTKFIQQVLW